MEIFKTEVSGSGSGLKKLMDPDTVNIRLDPQPCRQMFARYLPDCLLENIHRTVRRTIQQTFSKHLVNNPEDIWKTIQGTYGQRSGRQSGGHLADIWRIYGEYSRTSVGLREGMCNNGISTSGY